MAKYIVEETNRSKYEKNYKFPMINLIPQSFGVFQFIRS